MLEEWTDIGGKFRLFHRSNTAGTERIKQTSHYRHKGVSIIPELVNKPRWSGLCCRPADIFSITT